MEVMKSQDFRRAGEQANEILHLHGNDLGEKGRKFLEVQQKRARTLKVIENLTGLKFDVFRKADPHIAAFITVAGEETHIAEQTLDDPVWAAYAAWHEAMHKQTAGFMKMGKFGFLKHDYFEAVNDELKDVGVQLGRFDAVEGYTDLLTAREHGKHANSGYNEREVPAAEKLEKLCLATTGESLAEAFRQNNVPLFHERLERLAAVLLMRKAFDDFAKQDTELEGMRLHIEQKMGELKPILPDMVQSTEDAERVVGKLVAECVDPGRIRGFIASLDNENTIRTSKIS